MERSLEGLRRLGLHLDAEEAAEARARRRVRLHTRTYPQLRALGMQLLILAVVVHNVAVFGRIGGANVVAFAVASELYMAGAWWVLRRWYEAFGRPRGWDLSDLLFATDLILWAWAIQATGGPRSLIFFLPLLRVADHRAADKAMAFAHLGPLAYLAVVLMSVSGGGVDWGVEAAKLLLLYLAGVYVAWTGEPTHRAGEEREAALAAASAFLGRLQERTARLDRANRARSTLLDRLGADLRGSLVRIVGFSRHLVRDEPTGPGAMDFVRRIYREGSAALETLDRALDPDPAPEVAGVSVPDLLRSAARREAEHGAGRVPPAELVIPEEVAPMPGDPDRLTTVLEHLLAVGRHLQDGPPVVELEVASETGSPECVSVRVEGGIASREDELFDAFSPELVGNQGERLLRLELSMARTLAQGLGYDLVVTAEEDSTRITLRLR